MKDVFNRIKKYCQKYFNIIVKWCKHNKKLIYRSLYYILMTIPFWIIDLFTRYYGRKVKFFSLGRLVPNLFSFIWIGLFMCVCLSFKEKKRKIVYCIFVFSSLFFMLLNTIYYSVMNTFFDFSLLELVSEGSSYMLDSIVNASKIIYIIFILVVVITIVLIKYMPIRKEDDYKIGIIGFICFTIMHIVTPLFLGSANNDLSWNTWKNPRNVYIAFNDSNKSMSLSGLYEYTFRDFYVTYIKTKKTDNEEEREFLDLTYNVEEENYNTKYTGFFKDKNVILLQLEGIDKWLLNETDTPNLYSFMNNSFVFNNHYSFYNGGGSTFNSEFAVNTGFITPISYTQNAYTFNKNTFDYSLAKMFKQADYTVNSFHMNSSEYYSRGTNYHNWGYDNYYGLKDLGEYSDNSYELDRELILNETFRDNLIVDEGKFLDYIISYSNHTPFSTEKGVCKMLVEEDVLSSLTQEEIENGYELPILSEEDCARRQAKETDYMFSLLIDLLKEKGVYDNTVIVVFTDHYLYTLSDQSILEKYKETSNNLINNTPFFIWSSDINKTDINKVTSQLNILPTILNLFGLEYHPNYYIGEDALNPNYDGYVFFSDYSWYDGNLYVDGGIITNGKHLDFNVLEEKNYYINYLIKKNDLTLKYNYFKTMKNNTSI